MKLQEIKKSYEQGDMDKQAYMHAMFLEHTKLFEYQKLLQESGSVKRIVVEPKNVSVLIESRDAKGNTYPIKMALHEQDAGAVPVIALNLGSYEIEELSMINRIADELFAQEGGVMLDVGANLGWYTLNLCKQFKNLVSHAFEPVGETFCRMQQNIKLNQLDGQCRLHNFGLSNETKHEYFYYNSAESGASSLANLRGNDETKRIECSFMRMDEFVAQNEIQSIDFIKCDVEGAELLVYQGGMESIQKFKPVIFSEMLRKWAAKFNYHPNQIIEIFGGIGYGCYVIANGCLKVFERVDDDTKETNYLFLHKQKHAELIEKLK